MSSIIRREDTFHGISVVGRGVFTYDNEDGITGITYAGQCRDGYACGLGVLTWPDGSKIYAEYGPDGQVDGRFLFRNAHLYTFYCLFERGEEKDSAYVDADGSCRYNFEDCALDDPRLLALTAQVVPVEVRPIAPAPNPPLAPKAIVRCAGSFCPGRRSRPPWPPRCNPTPHAVADGCATQFRNGPKATHDHAVMHSLTGSK
jgi:hypothetical protein